MKERRLNRYLIVENGMQLSRDLIIKNGTFELYIQDLEELLDIPLIKSRKLLEIMFESAYENRKAIKDMDRWFSTGTRLLGTRRKNRFNKLSISFSELKGDTDDSRST